MGKMTPHGYIYGPVSKKASAAADELERAERSISPLQKAQRAMKERLDPRNVKGLAGTAVRRTVRGMLSPAGLAEGVAATVAGLSDAEGRDILHEKMEGTRSIKMPRGSKPTRRKA